MDSTVDGKIHFVRLVFEFLLWGKLYSVDELFGGTLLDVECNYAASPCRNNVIANNILGELIGTFNQHIGLNQLDKVVRRVFIKNDNGINIRE